MEIKQGAEEFYYEGNNGNAVLLIHGYTGTPGEMLPLGMYLNKLGYTVLGVRLPGHGGSLDYLEQSNAEQWYAEVERGFLQLKERFEHVMVAGLSMGALMAIKLTAQQPVHCAAFLSAPIFLPDKRIKFYPILKYFIRYLPKHKKNYRAMAVYNHCNEKMPTKPLGSLFAVMKACKHGLLQKITQPVLVLQSTVEHTVVPKSAQFIYDHVSTPAAEKKLVWYNRSGHILTLDVEHEAVYEEVGKFFDAHKK